MLSIYSKDLSSKVKQSVLFNSNIILNQHNIKPTLAIIYCNNESSLSYIKSKQKLALDLGIDIIAFDFSIHNTQESFLYHLLHIANNNNIHGVMIDLPIHSNIDTTLILNSIPFEKDVDGLSCQHLGLLSQYKESKKEHFYIIPATPQSCVLLAKSIINDFNGLNTCVIGNGKTVGKPLSLLLSNLGATVTSCNSKTTHLSNVIHSSDLIFTAIGKPHFLNNTHFRNNQIIIDSGISYKNSSLCGDVDYQSISHLEGFISAVPGGVGPLTTNLIFNNLIKLIDYQFNLNLNFSF